MHLMLQQPKSDDYVVATGEITVSRSLREAFAHVNLDLRDYVKLDETFYRSTEVDLLIGNASKAQRILQWRPMIAFAELIREMVDSDIELISSSTGRASQVRLLK
jgi:GDPmannose 4,6-dehydratase